MTLHTKQIALLRKLRDNGGSVAWADLTQGECTHGTKMSARLLCEWQDLLSYGNRKGPDSKLVITQYGLEAIEKEGK